MKKKSLFLLGLGALLALGGCSGLSNSSSSPTPDTSSGVTVRHLVTFYVDSEAWRTISVLDGDTIEITFSNPTSSSGTFVEWRTEAGVAYDFTVPVTSDLDLYAYFESSSSSSDSGETEELSVTDTKVEGVTYSLVMGWYGKTETSGCTVEIMTHFYRNIRIALAYFGMDETELASVTMRQYGDADTNVAALGELVNADGDVDLLFGVGNNINSTGNVSISDKEGDCPIGDKSRYTALVLQDPIKEMAQNIFDLMKTDTGKKMTDLTYTVTAEDIASAMNIVTYNVNFYVEVGGELYTTVTVNEGDTVSAPSTNPTKEGYTFVEWQTEAGVAYDFTTAVTADLNLYGYFEEGAVDPDPEDEYSVTDTKEEGKEYSLVVGWYGKSTTSGIDETVMKHYYSNLRVYLNYWGMTEEELTNVTVRQYGDADTNVAGLIELVQADGDVDILFGCGNNIDSKGLDCTKDGPYTIGTTDSRYTALVTHETIKDVANDLFTFMQTDTGRKMFDTTYTVTAEDITAALEVATTYTVNFYVEVGGDLYSTVIVNEGETVSAPSTNPTKEGYTFVEWQTEAGVAYDFTTAVTADLNLYGYFEETAVEPVEPTWGVEDTKVDGQEYSLVMGWYGKTSTSGCTVEIMTHFYSNIRTALTYFGMSDEDLAKVTMRRYGDEDTNVATMGELVNTDGDVDILFGVGNNINSTGGVSCADKEGNCPIGETTRYTALVQQDPIKEMAQNLFDLIKTDTGKKMTDLTYTVTAEDIASAMTVITTYTVNFYVEVGGDLYQTATVNEGDVVTAPETNPTKDGYTFVEWQTEAGVAYDFSTAVTADLSLYGYFEEVVVEPTWGVEDTKVEGVEYSLVLGWYGKTTTSGCSVEIMTHFYSNIRIALTYFGMTSSELANVTMRRYGDEDTGVAAMGELVNTDGDVDILFGVGNNINSTGGVSCAEKEGNCLIDGKSRYTALVQHDTIKEMAQSLFNLMKTDTGKSMADLTYTVTAEDIQTALAA